MSGSGIRGEVPDPTSRLLRGGSIYTLATAAQLGAGILVLPILTRILDAQQYGVVTSAMVVFTLLGVSVGLGLPGAINRAYFRGASRDLGRSHAQGLVWVTLGGALLAALALELSGQAWSAVFEEIEYGTALRIAVWSAVAFALLQAAQSVLRAEERRSQFVVSAIVATAGAQALGVAGAAAWGVNGYLAGMASGVVIAALLALVASGALRQARFERSVVLTNLRIGLPTVPHAVALYVLAAGDRVVVERLEGLSAVARYHVAYLIGFAVILLATAVNNAWSPIIYGADREQRWQVLAETASAVIKAIALVSGAVALVAPLALRVAAPPGYELSELADVTVLVAASALPFAWYLACGHVILWRGITWWYAIVTPLVAVANIALNFALIEAHGLIGAAIATLVSYSLLAILLLAVTRATSVPWQWPAVVQSVAIATALAALSLLIGDDGLWLVLRAALAAAVAAALVRFVLRSLRPRLAEAAP